MHDRNDIEFKGSLGSPPGIKWQLLSWSRGSLPLPPTPSLLHSFASKQRLCCKDAFPLLVGGGEAPGNQGSGETLKIPTPPAAARSPPVLSQQFSKRGNNPASLSLGSDHSPPGLPHLHCEAALLVCSQFTQQNHSP